MGTGFLSILNDNLVFARNEFFGIGVAVCLILLACASSYRMAKAAKAARLETQSAIQAIEAISSPSEFTDNFATIDEKLRGQQRFGGTWSEFVKTLIPPLDHIDSPDFRLYRSTKRPQDYFDSDHVLRDVKPYILESENLIGLGLIFTFLGLIAALLHAGINLGSANAEAVSTVIKDLLSTAGAKFFASLGGVFGALLQTVVRARVSERAETDLERFVSKLESLLPMANLEKIAAEQYAHAIRQTARLEEMGAEITLAIGSRIEAALASMPESMGKAMSGALAPTNDRLEEVSKGISSTSTDAIAKLVDEFSRQLTGAGEKSMNQVVVQLDSLSNTLGQTVSQLGSSNLEIKATMSALLEEMKKGGSYFGSAVKESSDAASEQFREISNSVADSLSQLIERLETQQEQNSQTLDLLVEKFGTAGSSAADAFKQSSENSAKEIANALQGAISGLMSSAERAGGDMAEKITAGVGEAGRAMAQGARDALEETSNSITESMNRVTEALEAWRSSVSGATTALQNATSALADHKRGLESVNARLIESGNTIGTATQALKETVAPLNLTSTQLNASTEALRQLIADTMSRLSDMGSVTNRSTEQIASAIQGMVSAWETQAEHLRGSDQQIEKAFRVVVTNLEQSLGMLSKFSNSLNDSLGNSLRDLGSIASELVEAVEELSNKK